MLARVAHLAMFLLMTWCLVAAGTPPATAQALCPEPEAQVFGVRLPSAPYVLTVEADLAALGGTRPGDTWRMPVSGGIAPDGLALEAVSFTRNAASKLGSSDHTFDVVVELRASDRILVGLEFVVVDGERSLALGRFKDIPVRCEAKRVSQTFSISDHDFVSYFAGGRAPTLRIKRTSVVGGC
jgi:hypothetical protein